jgi:hypothetical protein
MSCRKTIDFARRAVDVSENDPGILANVAVALAMFGEDIDAMIGLVDRALAFNPSFARGWCLSGLLRVWAGQPDLAIEHVETSLRLSPRLVGQSLSLMGLAHFVKRRFDEAWLWPFRIIRAFRLHTARSLRAMLILGASTKRARPSPGCARLPLT